MKYFLDTEFVETVGRIELISIGIVAEDGREFYRVNKDADLSNASLWVIENVLHQMPEYRPNEHDLKGGDGLNSWSIDEIRQYLLFWTGQKNNVHEICEFYGYFADYDWVVFCWIFGKIIDLPRAYPMYCRDLKQIADECGVSKEWITLNVPIKEDEHNALADAKWNKRLYGMIQEYYPYKNA